MPHPFADKLFVFIGNPTRCTRQAVREALTAVGGVTEERINTFTNYIVAFNDAEKTKVYKKAVEHDKYGHLVLLNENQFFDVLAGKIEPPVKKVSKRADGIIIFPSTDPSAERKIEAVQKYAVERRRLKNQLRAGDSASNADKRKTAVAMLAAALQIQAGDDDFSDWHSNSKPPEICATCGNASKVHIGNDGTTFVSLCQECHNELVAQIFDIDSPSDIPQKLSFKGNGGKTYNFAVELQMFPTGKLLTATEIGKSKRKTDVGGKADADVYEMFETLKHRIKKLVSANYMDKRGYFAKNKAIGYVEYNQARDACDVIIDGKPYTWSELERNIKAHEGWKIKIEFASPGEELD